MAWTQLERQARRLMLPRGPKAVMKALAPYAQPDGTKIFPGVALLVEETGYCTRSVQNFLRYLEREGWIFAIDRRGGRGRATLYQFSLDGNLRMVAQPPPPAEPLPPDREERFIQGILKRGRLSEERRAHWQTELARVQGELQTGCDLQREIDQGEASPAREQEEEQRLPAVIGVQALIPLQDIARDEALLQIEALYHGQLAMQAKEQPDSDAWAWWQHQIDQSRAIYNQALSERGIVASDGQEPAIDEELEAQIREEEIAKWQRMAQQREAWRDGFKPGSPGWNKWNKMAQEANEALNGLLYQHQQQGEYVT